MPMKKKPIRLILGQGAEVAKLAKERRQDEMRLLLCCPLHYAARARFNNVAERHKAVAIVELLLAHGADSWHSYNSETAVIHDVLRRGGIVEPLLALPQLDMERRDGRGCTLLIAACEPSQQDLSLVRAFDNLERHPSASMQKKYAVDRLCEMGADILAVDKKGNNVILILVTTEQYLANAVLPVLIAKFPALVRQTNQEKETALHLAARDRKWDIVRTLLDFGGDALTTDSQGNTILHYLAPRLHEKEYRNCPNTGTRRQMHDINAWNETTLWKEFSRLLDQGVDINMRNCNGETAIFEYVRGLAYTQSIRSPTTDALIAAGPDVLMRNHDGESLLHVAAKISYNFLYQKCNCKQTFTEPFSYLMELGLDPFRSNDIWMGLKRAQQISRYLEAVSMILLTHIQALIPLLTKELCNGTVIGNG